MCFDSIPGILNMLNVLVAKSPMPFFFIIAAVFLMYTQIAFVTSVRGILFLPQIAARSAESVLVAKSPMPFFFIIAAVFLPEAFMALLLWTPFGRLPPGYLTAFFFFFFFFFFLAFFFFFFFFFLAPM